jgi:hypothetical protein
MIRCDDIQVGDMLTDTLCSSDKHGPVRAIRPYRCNHPGCGPNGCAHDAWRVLVYKDGTEVTLVPGASWSGRLIRD